MSTSVSMIVIATLVLGTANPSRAEGNAAPLKVRLCDLHEHPEQYAGKMVEVRARIVGRDDPTLDDFSKPPCSTFSVIALTFPHELRADAPFELEKNSSLREYDAARGKPMGIEATIQGRFDSIIVQQDGDRARAGKGYGKKSKFESRLVVRELKDVFTWRMPKK